MLVNSFARATFLVAITALASLAACGSDNTGPTLPSDVIQLTGGQVSALDSAVKVAVGSNPSNPDLKALLDSAIDALAAGVQAKRIDVNTDLTTAPLFFVGIHRAYSIAAGGSFSTWTVVAFDDPSHVSTMIDLGGFAPGGAAPPNSASGTIGGDGVGNARFFHLAPGGAVTYWIVSSGTESFVSDSTTRGGTCPGFKPIPHVTCTVETLHLHFDVTAAGSVDGATGARHATVVSGVEVPTMRLDYTL